MHEFQRANWKMVKPLALARVPSNGWYPLILMALSLTNRSCSLICVCSLPCVDLSLVGLFSRLPGYPKFTS
jgi:hypothetical protein